MEPALHLFPIVQIAVTAACVLASQRQGEKSHARLTEGLGRIYDIAVIIKKVHSPHQPGNTANLEQSSAIAIYR